VSEDGENIIEEEVWAGKNRNLFIRMILPTIGKG
jgi:hypothetical protein